MNTHRGFAPLDAVVRGTMERWAIPGMAIGIYRDGAVETYGWGVESLETGFPVRPDTLFQIGSISKVFCATLVMRLVDEGRLDLDTPVVEYIPGLELADPATRDRITIRHLLSHTGGFWGDYYTDQGPGDDALAKSLPGFAGLTQRHAPGDLWTYCNAGFNLIGIAIERLLGMTYEQAMANLVFAPLDLDNSFYFAHEAICYPVSVGHLQVKPGSDEHRIARRYYLPRVNNPDGGIISNVEDVLTFAAFHLGDGTVNGKRLLSMEALAEMQRPHVKAVGWSDAWGLGWHVIHAGPDTLVGHDGSTIGFQSLLTLAPAKRLAIVCLTNSSRGSAATLPIAEWALAHYVGIERPRHTPVSLTAGQLARFAGRYRNETSDAGVSVVDGGRDVSQSAAGTHSLPGCRSCQRSGSSRSANAHSCWPASSTIARQLTSSGTATTAIPTLDFYALAACLTGWTGVPNRQAVSRAPNMTTQECPRPIQRPATQRSAGDRALLVVAQARLVVGEEDLADQFAPAVDAGLLEDVLEVLLDGLRRDGQRCGDLRGGIALQDQPGDILLALGQAVGGHQQGRDARRVGRFDDHGDPRLAAGDQRRAVQHHPAAAARKHPRQRDLTRRVRRARRCAAPGRRPRALPAAACRCAVQSPSGNSSSQRSTPGVSESTLQSLRRMTRPGASGPSGSADSPTSRPRLAPSAR